MGIDAGRLAEWREEARRVEQILGRMPTVEKSASISKEEFQQRRRRVAEALRARDISVGLVFSDEHYDGDVPYLGGNTNITIEQVAGAVGPGGFHIIAGLEGGYVAEQLAPRAGARVRKVELLQLADEKYPIEAERLEDVLEEAAAGEVRTVGLLTPRQVLPAALLEYVQQLVGRENVVDIQEIYYRIKYEKSDQEMRLIRDANLIANAMMRAMLAVVRPGILETQVASWGYLVGRELGAEEMGWDIMVTSGEGNRTLIGKALNRPLEEGQVAHIGVAPKRDGLNSCLRRSFVVTSRPERVRPEQKYWFDFVEEAFEVGFQAYCEVARHGTPARLQEEALVDFFRSRSDEVSRRIGREIQLEHFKPYTGTHNAGYTECQEFFGAITLDSHEPLGHQIVTMLDVAVRGMGNRWDEVVIPDLDFVVVENTLGKFGPGVEDFNSAIPRNVQSLVGNADRLP